MVHAGGGEEVCVRVHETSPAAGRLVSRQQRAHVRGQENVVGIAEGKEITVRGRRCNISRIRRATIGNGHEGDEIAEALADRPGAVGGAVVDDDDLHVLVGLREGAGDGSADRALGVEGGDQDADDRGAADDMNSSQTQWCCGSSIGGRRGEIAMRPSCADGASRWVRTDGAELWAHRARRPAVDTTARWA